MPRESDIPPRIRSGRKISQPYEFPPSPKVRNRDLSLPFWHKPFHYLLMFPTQGHEKEQSDLHSVQNAMTIKTSQINPHSLLKPTFRPSKADSRSENKISVSPMRTKWKRNARIKNLSLEEVTGKQFCTSHKKPHHLTFLIKEKAWYRQKDIKQTYHTAH